MISKMDNFRILDVIYNLRTVSLIRFVQLWVVGINIGLILAGTTFGPILLIYMFLYTRLWFLSLLYVIWIYVDREAGFRGGRQFCFLRNLKFFHYFRDYFPIKLIKTVDLPSDKNYLLVMYPHGILGYSVLVNFATNANNFDNLYPNLEVRQITLNSNFYAPITREYLSFLGGCAASESSMLYLLNDKTPKAVVLVAGGAQESIIAHPGTYKIIINKRKGFVRIALKSGASLVPVISFGENNVHYQYAPKWWSRVQRIFHKYTRIMPIIPVPLAPLRKPINTVIGAPMSIPKVENPSEELINEYHEKFKHELFKLFETYKGTYDTKNGIKAKLEMY